MSEIFFDCHSLISENATTPLDLSSFDTFTSQDIMGFRLDLDNPISAEGVFAWQGSAKPAVVAEDPSDIDYVAVSFNAGGCRRNHSSLLGNKIAIRQAKGHLSFGWFFCTTARCIQNDCKVSIVCYN